MVRKARQEFNPELKREAVRLLEQGDKEVAQLARELGIRRNQLYKWKEQIDLLGGDAFPGKGRRTKQPKTDDTIALKAELKRLREENEILKKAAIFFAKESQQVKGVRVVDTASRLNDWSTDMESLDTTFQSMVISLLIRRS
jgi:transposase